MSIEHSRIRKIVGCGNNIVHFIEYAYLIYGLLITKQIYTTTNLTRDKRA